MPTARRPLSSIRVHPMADGNWMNVLIGLRHHHRPPPLDSLSTVQCVFVEREQEHYCANREQLMLVNPPDAGKGLFNASYFGSSPFGALEGRAGGRV